MHYLVQGVPLRDRQVDGQSANWDGNCRSNSKAESESECERRPLQGMRMGMRTCAEMLRARILHITTHNHERVLDLVHARVKVLRHPHDLGQMNGKATLERKLLELMMLIKYSCKTQKNTIVLNCERGKQGTAGW